MYLKDYIVHLKTKSPDSFDRSGTVIKLPATTQRKIKQFLWFEHTYAEEDYVRRQLAMWTTPVYMCIHHPERGFLTSKSYSLFMVLSDGKRFVNYGLTQKHTYALVHDDRFSYFSESLLLVIGENYRELTSITKPFSDYCKKHHWTQHAGDATLLGAGFSAVLRPSNTQVSTIDADRVITSERVKEVLCPPW